MIAHALPVQEPPLRSAVLAFIRSVAAKYPAVERIMLFGSRAAGTHRPGSDVDLAVYGGAFTYSELLHFRAALNETAPALLRFDVVQGDALSEGPFKTAVESGQVLIYERIE